MLKTNADKGFGLLSFLNMCTFQKIFYIAELPKKCPSHSNLGIKWVSKIKKELYQQKIIVTE